MRVEGAVFEIFEFWRDQLSNARSKLDERRKRAITSRLRDGYSVEDLKMAILGCKSSDWHNGANDRHQRYVSIELICRDADHVDRFIEIAERLAEAELRRVAETGPGREEARPRRSPETEAKIAALLERGARAARRTH